MNSASNRIQTALARPRLLLPLLFLTLASGCLSSGPDPQWIADTVEARSEGILWKVTVFALQKTGFPIGSGLEPGKLLAVSGWKTNLAPFKGEGFRERCTIEYEPVEGQKYAMKVRVEVERNQDIVHPLDLSYAEWEPAQDNVEKSRIVLGYVKAMLGPGFEVRDKEKPMPKSESGH